MNRYLSALFLILLWTTPVMADENISGHLTGAWIPPKIGPIAGALIYVFNAESGPPPERKKSHRVPDAVDTTDEAGKFSLELAEGNYYLAAWKKHGGQAPGPPQDGELHALSRDKKGKPIIYTVKRSATTDCGILQQGTAFKSPIVKISAGMTAISGMLTTPDGSPLPDAIVQVHADQETMGKPMYVSQKTGKDGKYIIQVGQEGTYFATVRAANAVGRPQAGTIFGKFGGETALPVPVKNLHVTKGIDIQVDQFIDKRPE